MMNNKSIERIAVVVVNYKAIDDTVACIQALLKQSISDFTIIVVENGSHDGSAERLEELGKQHKAKIIPLYNSENLGFTGGVNTGITWAQNKQYDYVALLNNDAVADTKWLESLLDRAKLNKECGIVTSLLLHIDGKTIDSTGEQYSIWGLGFPRDRNKETASAPKGGFVLGATGGASLYRMDMFNEIGLFDDIYFAYYEDIDISFRAQLRGWKVYYEPSAIAFHKQGATSKKIPGFTVQQIFKNLPIVFIKNIPRELLLLIGIRLYFAYVLIFINALKNGNASPAFKGLAKSIPGTIHAFKSRGSIQRTKKVPTDYIKGMLWHDLPPDQTGIRNLRKFFTGKK
jgi:GT2 family glycosyltransferase